MGQRVTMFLLPFVVVGVSRLGSAASIRLFPVPVAVIAALAVYYVAIAASVMWVRRAIPGAQRAPSLYSGTRPSARRVAVAVVLPALPLLGFFLLHLAPVAPAVVGAIVVFSVINATFEEAFWRGLMAHLPAPDWIRIFYPAAVFAFAHWFNFAAYVPMSPMHVKTMVLATFILGVVWMWFYLRERSLVYPIASHFAIDLFSVLAAAMSLQTR